MKNIFKFIFSSAIILNIVACSDLESDVYTGSEQLNFNQGQVIDESVIINTSYKDVTLTYGTLTAVDANHQVDLVFDSSQSSAVEGVDFDIIKGSDSMEPGDVGGDFVVRIYEPAQGVINQAFFTLGNTSLPRAQFDQSVTLNWQLQCRIEDFFGGSTTSGFFDVDPGLFNSGWVQEVLVGSEPNTMILDDYISTGYDIELSYNEAGQITFLPQETGYIHPSYGMISMKMATDGSVSTYNACNRTMTLSVNYYVSAGSFGNMQDIFTGL